MVGDSHVPDSTMDFQGSPNNRVSEGCPKLNFKRTLQSLTTYVYVLTDILTHLDNVMVRMDLEAPKHLATVTTSRLPSVCRTSLQNGGDRAR